MTHPLAPLRAEIDAIDDQIVALLRRRMDVAHRVAAVKREHGIPVVIPERVEAVLDRAAEAAAASGLDPAYLRRLYGVIIDETCRVEATLVG